MTVKSSISLTDEQDAFIRSLVAAGRYPSASAVLQQGVDLLRRQMEAEEADVAALRAILSERLGTQGRRDIAPMSWDAVVRKLVLI